MTRRKNKLTKISILVLLLLSLFLSVKYYKISDDFKAYTENSELENKVLESQLTEILHKYDSLSVKNKIDSLRKAIGLNSFKEYMELNNIKFKNEK